jgi:hypothetical protein
MMLGLTLEAGGRLTVANKHGKRDVDIAVDLHGLTVEQMRLQLQRRWYEWRGMSSVRVVHGQGESLRPALIRWCEEMGIPYAPDPGNPGSLRLFPTRRTLPDNPMRTTLKDHGLSLTPEQEAELRDPGAAERARQEALKRQREEERRREEAAVKAAGQRRRDEALWQAEMARLEAIDRKRPADPNVEQRPRAPVILPPVDIRHQEGYWRSELVRVADADTDTLKQNKRHGLDKLAPPMPPKPAVKEEKAIPRRASSAARDTAADRALFEAELARLEGDRSD